MSDWFKYYRSSAEHHLRCRPFIWIYWIHCLESAAWKEHTVFWKGEEFLLQRGHFISTIAKDQGRNGLSPSQIRNARKVLKRCHMIDIQSSRQGTLIKVNNWNDFQVRNGEAPQTMQHKDDTPTAHERHTNDTRTATTEERKKVKKERKKRITTDAPAYSDEFESFWNEYPKREDKAEAWELFKEIGLNEQLLDFAKKYAAEFKGTRKQYAKKAKYMLRNQEWLSWMNGNKPAPAPNFTKRSREQDQLAKARGCTDFSFYRAIIKASHPNLNPEMISKAWDLSLHYKTIIEDPNHANHQHRPTQN